MVKKINTSLNVYIRNTKREKTNRGNSKWKRNNWTTGISCVRPRWVSSCSIQQNDWNEARVKGPSWCEDVWIGYAQCKLVVGRTTEKWPDNEMRNGLNYLETTNEVKEDGNTAWGHDWMTLRKLHCATTALLAWFTTEMLYNDPMRSYNTQHTRHEEKSYKSLVHTKPCRH